MQKKGRLARFFISIPGIMRKLGRDAVRRMNQASGINQAQLHDSIPGDVGAAENNGRLLQSVQDAPGQGAKPCRARLSFRFQEATKGVQIMAEDARPFRRQHANQMGVTMIANVEVIEIISLLTEMSRIIPKAGQQPISIPSGLSPADEREPPKTLGHCRLNTLHAHFVRRPNVKLRLEHVRDQIHTGPVLFGEIAD
jgi:hypothetical protein